jgi:hypothetical protein
VGNHWEIEIINIRDVNKSTLKNNFSFVHREETVPEATSL